MSLFGSYTLKLRSLSVIIPAFNEEQRLPKTLNELEAFFENLRLEFLEILVVDDGSTDRTAEVVRDMGSTNPHLRLLQNPGNLGKGYAVRQGMLKAAGEWRLMTDADLSTPIGELSKLYHCAVHDGAVVSMGSRALDRRLVSIHQSVFREFGGRFFNLLMRVVTGLPFLDTQCGFKLYRGDGASAVFSRQILDGFSFDVEDVFIANHLGLKVIEVPVLWANVEGTKVGLCSTVRAFLDLFRIRFFSVQGKYD
jgi:dolichyl-phosphate beta-glucosyltransferase